MIRTRATLMIVCLALNGGWASAGGDAVDHSAPLPPIHDVFGSLLQRFVVDDRVDYASWAASEADRAALAEYITSLESFASEALGQADALAYWINLYNAATVDAILTAYPIESIRAIFPDEPDRVWTDPRVRVGNRRLSLNDIENDVIRPTFRDPRIHFALNCASLGCPPLQPWAFDGADLDTQLDAVTRRALNDPRWVRLTESGATLTKIFEWFESDFVSAAGSVAAFIAHYRPDAGDPASRSSLIGQLGTVAFAEYDWRLNTVR